MTGSPVGIHLKPGAVPFAVHTPRPIPFALKDQVKEELDFLVKQGIITPAGSPFPPTTHTPKAYQVPPYGITLNKDKFTVAAPKVNFCDNVLSSDGIVADPVKVSIICDFPTPSNVTDLRSFMGLVNQLADFTPDIADTAQHLNPLISPKRSFIWTPDHEQPFKKVKTALTSPLVLAPFNPALPAVLRTDTSCLYGLGYALLQENSRSQTRLVQCGSRFLTDTETLP
ncbi:uncharacterized protein LOC135199087 [Macrobrachium nipponense]|uniref:uncharacterized protein LOC135199087 n=1 Tax=Macrobrachium nipponense TaxID=159736 RepID=UPI0030C80EC6